MNFRAMVTNERTKKTLFYLLAALLGGCLPVVSLHPLYTEKDLIFEQKLLGKWVDDPNNPETTWRFSRIEEMEKAYGLEFFDGEGKKGSFIAHLVRLQSDGTPKKTMLFLDVFPAQMPWEIEDPNKVELPYNALFLMPVHTFIKIDSIEPDLKMRLTNEEDMKKLLAEKPSAVEHTFIEKRLILTASTKELQNFLLKYADDERVFKNEIVLGR
ncbi:MAG: hypothetical protein JW837_06415 [Sedimentisphaerales bacterium]|nr:hypothetical protein [Sedimentisphaerales bacterium]